MSEVTSARKTDLKQGLVENVIDQKGSTLSEERSSMVERIKERTEKRVVPLNQNVFTYLNFFYLLICHLGNINGHFFLSQKKDKEHLARLRQLEIRSTKKMKRNFFR